MPAPLARVPLLVASLVVAAWAALPPGSASAAPAGPRRPMREEDLLDLRWVADPQISPDGSRIVFTRVVVDSTADEYRTSLWEIDARGGDPRPLTSGQRDAQPRWSPDGR